MVFANLLWTPQSIGLWGLLGGLPLIFAYFVGREICAITYGLDRRLRHRTILLTVAKVFSSVVLLAATIFVAISSHTHWLIEASIWVLFILFPCINCRLVRRDLAVTRGQLS